LTITRLPITDRDRFDVSRHPLRRPFHRLATAIALLPLFAAPAGAVGLVEVYQQAREYDATLQGAAFELESARQVLPQARSAFRPQAALSGEIGLTRFDADNPNGDADGPDSSDDYVDSQIGLQLSQTLFNRQNGALVDQARIGVRQAEAVFAASAQDLVLRVATAYFDVLRAEANVEFSQSELESIERQRDQAERRFDVGLIPITDVRTAQAQYDLAVAQEIAASDQYTTTVEALRVISGIEVDTLDSLAEDLPLIPPDPADIDAWVTLAKEQNLPLVIAGLSSDIAQTRIQAQRAQRLPTLDVVLSGALSTTDQDLRPESTRAATIGLQTSVPLFTGGRIKAQIAEARADYRALEQDFIAQERSAVQQARDGYRGVIASISRVNALRQALDSTRQSAEAVEAGFRAGTRTSVDVLRALRDVFRARSDYANARYDYLLNSFRLKSAAGTLDETDLVTVNRFLQPEEEPEEGIGGQ